MDIIQAIKILKSEEWDLQELSESIKVVLESWSNYNKVFDLMLLDGTITNDELAFYVRKASEILDTDNYLNDLIKGEN